MAAALASSCPSSRRCCRSVSDAERTKISLATIWSVHLPGLGALASASPDLMASLISQLTALRTMFVFYPSLGVAGGVLYAQIPGDISLVTETSASALDNGAGSSTGWRLPLAFTRLPAGCAISDRLVALP
jgi:hypothetical protein